MKVYEVTETYTVKRVLKVLAPDEPAAQNYGIHPQAMVLDYGSHDEYNHKFDVVEQKRKETK